jgi:ribA/ribD-fused uncharacterized protein
MWTRETLIEHVRGGGKVRFLLFWGHTPKRSDAVDASCLSQWFPCPFEVDGVVYPTAEHFMMAGKARLFRDERAVARVVAARSPADAKAVGREVAGFEDAAWARARSAIVVQGNVAKFGQNEALGAFLRRTGDSVLVEASPRDTIWGIGLGASNPKALDPATWRGKNLLGFALMEAREKLGAR